MDNEWEKLQDLEERLERIGCQLSYGISYDKDRPDHRNAWLASFVLEIPYKGKQERITRDYAFIVRGLAMQWLLRVLGNYTVELESHINGPTSLPDWQKEGQS